MRIKNDDTKAIKVSPVTTGVAGNYVVDPTSSTTEFESVENIERKDYNLRVNGLAEGTYYLVETKAPDGFNKLTAPVEIKITKITDTDVNNWTIPKLEQLKLTNHRHRKQHRFPPSIHWWTWSNRICCDRSSSCIRCSSKLHP